MSDVTVSNLIQSAAQQNAVDFRTAFDALMLDKIASAVETKKQEIAQSYFDTEKQEVEPNEDTEAAA